MSKFKLAFGIHNHQPVGNFDAVFEEAHQKAYLPFLRLVKKFSKISISLHQSGILWNWQKEKHPDYFKLVGEMVKAGQIELLTGGFYEPIITSIPERDVAGQLAMLNQYLQKQFKVEPAGMWLTERVWEPHLPKVLARCGVQYLPVDDTHFVYAGFQKSQLVEPFVTESDGHTLTLLPIQERLRYLIPFRPLDELITELKGQAEKNPEGLAVYADDGEKFGVWPGTHKHCFEEKWLENFFEEVSKNSDWLEVITLGEAAERKPAGRAYLPSSSYSEMLHWSLPSEAIVEYESFENWLKESGQFERFGRFVRGGHWRGFLSKYEESNLMHKKMLAVSERLNAFHAKHPEEVEATSSVKEDLYAAQCNCPYWHGVFGGLYLPHIRQAVYSKLVAAEQKLNDLESVSGFRAEFKDYDSDGTEEITAANNFFSAVFKPDRGGMLLELSLLRHSFSLTDTLSRRREAYHQKLEQASIKHDSNKADTIHNLVIAKEENLQSFLLADWYLKRCFMDHFLHADTRLEEFKEGRFKEEGDFILEPYSGKINQREDSIELERKGNLWVADKQIPIQLTKTFRFNDEEEVLRIHYVLKSLKNTKVDVLFGIENNFNFQAGHAEDRYILVDGVRGQDSYLDSSEQHDGASSFAMIDEYRHLAVSLEADNCDSLWHVPIFTVSLSEGGFEKVYQGTTFLNLYSIQLSKSPFSIDLTLFAGSLKDLPEKLRQKTAVGTA